MVVDHFESIGHQKIVAFVPQFRNKGGQVKDRQVLDQLAERGVVVFTPSREIDNKRITSYDDTFILDYAAKHGGVVVTRDNFKDLANEKAEWHEVVSKRILMPTFVGDDDLMWPHDPLGRGGPTLDEFLKF
jgi:ribonuclease ZC3H12